MRKKIVMVMGVQRSGTTALFDALSHGKVTGFNERMSDYIYDNYYLRPESELRPIFEELLGSVLLKPISETFRRSVLTVFEEYSAYDLHIVWIYRDPVNATHSLQLYGFSGPPSTVPELAEQWNQRNQSVLDALPLYAGCITIVRYEDLTASPSMLAAIGDRVGIEASPNFRGDSGVGRRNMAPETQALVDAMTREMRVRMDEARTILPRTILPRTSVSTASTAAPDIYSPAFSADPHGHYRHWRESAGVHRLYQPNSWLLLNYDNVASILRDTQRFSTPHYRALSRHCGRSDPPGRVRLRRLLEPHFSSELMRLQTTGVEKHTRRLLAELSSVGEFDLVTAFAFRLTADLGAEHSGIENALLAPIVADSQITEDEVEDLRRFIPVAGFVLSQFIGNAIHYLLIHPKVDVELRSRPADISAFVDEMLRLAPPASVIQRVALCPVEIAGIEIPAEAHIYLAIAAANRDPVQHQQPDEMILHRAGPPHLSFGIGPNACLGRYLGQLECETAMRVLLVEFPRLRLTPPKAEIGFTGAPWLYGPAALPVRFE